MSSLYYFAIFFFLFGLALGSFINVVILRLAEGKSIRGRSRCPKCSRQLLWYENIPLLSFIFLRGKCRSCHSAISWQYPLVELASGILWLMSYLVIASHAGGRGEAILYSGQGIASSLSLLAMTQAEWLGVITFGVFSSFLLILFVFDFRWYILPDAITIPAIIVALVLNLILGKDWPWLLGATALGALWFGLQYFVSRGKWVGSGDIRLGALMGAMLASWHGLLLTLMLSYIVGSLVAVVLLLLKKKGWKSELPFGAFLTAATTVTLLWGEVIWDWYLGLLW
ncbi:MAG: prepilin peptidase [Patescibacteria group bacterium]